MSMSRIFEEQTKTFLKESAQWNSHLKTIEELQGRYWAIVFVFLTSFLVLSEFQVPKMQEYWTLGYFGGRVFLT